MIIILKSVLGPVTLESLPEGIAIFQGWALTCPGCHVRRALRPPSHPAHVANGRITIRSRIFCPTPFCGWHVRIANSRVTEIPEENHSVSLRMLISGAA